MEETRKKKLEICNEKSWEAKLEFFDLVINQGRKLRPIRFLIRHIMEKEYSKFLYAGSSLFDLLITLPDDKMDIPKTLSVGLYYKTPYPSFKFRYRSKLSGLKETVWVEVCQPTEIIDTFEYFLQTHEDWSEIKKRHANNG